MPNAAYSRVDITGDLTVALTVNAAAGKRLELTITDPDRGMAKLSRDEVEHLRDACNDWLEAA